MEILIQILLRCIPVLIISATLIYLFHEYVGFVKSRPAKETHGATTNAAPTIIKNEMGANDTLMRLKLQAAERFVLYLERISPGRIVMRLHQGNMSAKMLQTEVLKSIRDEFDHNLSQQIYVSDSTWILINNAKEELIKLVNLSADSLGEGATSLDLGKKIFESAAKIKTLPTELALQALRKEVQSSLK